MNRKLNLTLALAAGLLGGLLSRYLTPTSVLAQPQTPAPRELRAQSFVLVNESGAALGEFAIDHDGMANIKLYDQKANAEGMNHVIWIARGMSVQSLGGPKVH
jgi:hypothetical protein